VLKKKTLDKELFAECYIFYTRQRSSLSSVKKNTRQRNYLSSVKNKILGKLRRVLYFTESFLRDIRQKTFLLSTRKTLDKVLLDKKRNSGNDLSFSARRDIGMWVPWRCPAAVAGTWAGSAAGRGSAS
jgi:hypothetical protein